MDHGTQYTPPGFPPTYRPQPPQDALALALDVAQSRTETPARDLATPTDAAPAHASSAAAIAPTERGIAPAAPAVTEPTEPQLRPSPQPAAPAHDALTRPRSSSRESVPAATEPASVPPAVSTVLQVPASPAKRARPQEPSLKVMPLQYETCDVKDLGVLISDMLMELVRLNDGYPLRDGTLTRFHSRCVFPTPRRTQVVPLADSYPSSQSPAWHIRPRLPLAPHRARYLVSADSPLHGLLRRQAVRHVPRLHNQQLDGAPIPDNGRNRGGQGLE